MDVGIIQAAGHAPASTLPVSWIGKSNSPPVRPDWAAVGTLTTSQQKNLLSQIGYNLSLWDYAKVGTNNELGRYQFSVQTLEQYELISPGAYATYGIDAVNYQHCWRTTVNTYAEYNYGVANAQEFLSSTTAQELLGYQYLLDLYNSAVRITVIRTDDTAEIVAGMLYVCWKLGVGTAPQSGSTQGTGAYAWRYHGIGSAASYYNAGRYSVRVLS